MEELEMIETTNLVGIHIKDPQLPGTLYLTEEGDLTKDTEKAKRIPDSRLARALRDIKQYSSNFFTVQVAD